MKKVICVILLIIISTSFCGCGRKPGESFTESGRFSIVSNDNPMGSYSYYETIIADKDTGVLYLVIYAASRCGITPLLNADGTPMLWKEMRKDASCNDNNRDI